jgi:hypothetical protein
VTSPRRAAKNVSVNMPSEPPASGTGKRSPAAGSKEYPRERAQKGARGASVTRVVFHPLAERELIESARFYGARASGLGGDFSATVRSGETAWKRRKIFRYAATSAKRSFLPRLRWLWAARASGCGRF